MKNISNKLHSFATINKSNGDTWLSITKFLNKTADALTPYGLTDEYWNPATYDTARFNGILKSVSNLSYSTPTTFADLTYAEKIQASKYLNTCTKVEAVKKVISHNDRVEYESSFKYFVDKVLVAPAGIISMAASGAELMSYLPNTAAYVSDKAANSIDFTYSVFEKIGEYAYNSVNTVNDFAIHAAAFTFEKAAYSVDTINSYVDIMKTDLINLGSAEEVLLLQPFDINSYVDHVHA